MHISLASAPTPPDIHDRVCSHGASRGRQTSTDRHGSGIREITALAAAVRATRKRHELTQADLAGLAGVSLGFLIALEGGKPTVALNKVVQVIAALGLRLSVSQAQ
ncbi:MAG: hypothetical protein ACTHNM_16655 [Dyella sp.]|uniref:hypothetical protein n=1 Tax=Dyella sp. TaxID=1869338 RepID=UPI003F800ACC